MPCKNWKLQTRLLVREGAPHQQTRKCLKNNQRENGKNWSRVPDECLTPRQTGRLTVGRNVTLTWRRVTSLLNENQFGLCACHSTTLQCMRLTDHVTLNFNNKISTAAVFLDIEKAFDTTWHPGLLYRLSTSKFSTRLIRLISAFLSRRKRRRNVYAKIYVSTRCRPVPHSIQLAY
jgi:hypothetical protein